METGDQIICRGLQFECELGFHGFEKGLRQKIIVDFAARVAPLQKSEADQIRFIRLDYYAANEKLTALLTNRRFNLIETVAEETAWCLLDSFDIRSVEVTVTKFPLDTPKMTSVSYVCRREKT